MNALGIKASNNLAGLLVYIFTPHYGSDGHGLSLKSASILGDLDPSDGRKSTGAAVERTGVVPNNADAT